MRQLENLAIYPGGDLVSSGLADLANHVHSERALLVLIAGPRLRALGFDVVEPDDIPLPYEHRLFEALEDRLSSGAHMEYNVLIARMVSFADSYRPGP